MRKTFSTKRVTVDGEKHPSVNGTRRKVSSKLEANSFADRDKVKQDKAESRTEQGKAGQGRARQGKAGQGRARQDRAGQGRAGQDRAGQGRAGQGKTRQGKAR